VVARRIETAFTVPREGPGFPRSEMSSSASSPRFARRTSPAVSSDDDEVVPHELAVRFPPFGAVERQTMNEDEVCNLSYDARARPTELRTLSRAGAVARFAVRRWVSPPPGEPRRSAPPSGACLAARRLPLRVSARFGIALALAFATSPLRHLPEVRSAGDEPRVRCVRRRSPPLLDDAPSCDDPPPHHGERRGPRPARGRLSAARRSRARPLLKGVEHRGSPSSRKAPNTLCRRPGCAKRWRALHALAC